MKSFLVPRILEDNEDFPIAPDDIEFSNGINFVGAFDHNEQYDINEAYTNEKMNEGAAIVVWACQKQGHWGPCNPYELVYAHEEGTFSLSTFLHGNHRFNGLVVKGQDGLWRVTNAFIIYCYLAAPKIRKRKPAIESPTKVIESGESS